MMRIAVEQPSQSDIEAAHAALAQTYWSAPKPMMRVVGAKPDGKAAS